MEKRFERGTYVTYVIAREKIIQGHVLGYTESGDLLISLNDNQVNLIMKEYLGNVIETKSPLLYGENKMVRVTKEITFDSCHNLLDYDGACANLHGHTYKLQVTLIGKCDEKGFLVDFKDLKKIIKEEIVDQFDHAYLNDLMPFNTTAENMVKYIYELISMKLPVQDRYVRVESVKLWETPTSFAEYRGEVIF